MKSKSTIATLIACFHLAVIIGLLCFPRLGLCQTPIVCGQTINGAITNDTQIDLYSFTGTAGQVVSFVFQWGCYNGGEVDIYYPGASSPSNILSAGCSGNIVTVTLPSSGTYTLFVHETGYNGVNSYQLSVQSITGGGCNSTPIACGQTINGSINNATQIVPYNFVGAAGQVVSFVLQWGCYNGGEVDIYYPGASSPSNILSAGCSGNIVTVTLPSSGTYTLFVHETGYNGVNSYQLSVQSITGGGCNSTPIACGQTINGSINNATQIVPYNFVGAAGQVVSFVLQWGCYNGGEVDIYYPGASSPSNILSAGCSGNIVTVTLPSSGTYTLFVHETGYNGVNSYQLSVQSITGGGCNSTPIACGQMVSTNLTYATEIKPYGYDTGGGLVIFSFSGYGGARFDLYDPTGNMLFTETPGTATNLVLAAGAYTLLVHDSGYNGTGSYAFTVTCVGCNYLINPSGVSVGASATNGTITVTTGSGCLWTTTTNASWLRITNGSSGTGNGTVSYTVDANTSASARVGTMTIQGFTFIVNQASPVIFVGQDIGTPGASGSFSYSNGTYIVNGSGEGTDGSADVFYFAHQTLAGDAEIMARLPSLQGGDPRLAEAGIMIRETLDPGSKQASLTVNASTNVIFRRRLATNNISILNSVRGTNYLQAPNYIWLRLMRMGNTFVAHYSTNGLNWQYMWFTTVNMSNQVQVGLAVTAHYYGQLATATFDNLSLGSLTPLSGTWPLPGPKFLLGGENWSPAELQRVGGFEFLLGGVVGDYFNINSSTNIATPFANWSTFATVTNTYGVVPILDSSALTNHVRFYRAQRIGP